MPKTPVLQENSEKQQRFSPYNKSISKNLLTPCRRMGLSRKRKSLSSPFNTSLESTAEETKIFQETNETEEQALNHEKIKTKSQKHLLKRTVDLIPQASLKSKTEKCKDIEADINIKNSKAELQTTNESKKLRTLDNDDAIKMKIKSEKSLSSSVDLIQTPSKTIINITENLKSLNKPKENIFTKLLDAEENEDKNVISQNVKTSQDDLSNFQSQQNSDFINQHIKKENKWRRTLSMKKMEKVEQSAIKEGKEIAISKGKDCTVQIMRITHSDPTMENETANLQHLIAEKRQRLQDLKQAEIYKKMHDVESLNNLTELWKKGCISGLTDLLAQLKNHAEIDMGTLLMNLRIPKEYIVLSSNGELV